MKYKIIMALIVLIGLTLLVCYGSWQLALGSYLLIWANNMDFVKKIK